MLPKKDLEAIHQQDIKNLLERWGMLDSFVNGEITCFSCKDVITESNFGAVFSKDKEIFFSCSKLDCFANLPHS